MIKKPSPARRGRAARFRRTAVMESYREKNVTNSHAAPTNPPPSPAVIHGRKRFHALSALRSSVQFRATRRASCTSARAVTPSRKASLRTMKIACSKSFWSGESITTTCLDMPFTMPFCPPIPRKAPACDAFIIPRHAADYTSPPIFSRRGRFFIRGKVPPSGAGLSAFSGFSAKRR